MALGFPRFSQNARLQNASENKPPLKQGERGEAVVVLQLALIDLGASMPRSTKNNTVLPDGIFGLETFQAVSDFQRLNGLSVDGVAGQQTLAEIERQIVDLVNAGAVATAAKVTRRRFS